MRSFLGVALVGLAASAFTLPVGFYDRPLVSGLSGPTCFAIAPDGRIFAGQKTGAIRIYKNKQLLATPFMNVPCTSNSERGVLGIALDPNFATNRYVYVYYTTSGSSLLPPATPKNRVSRFIASGDVVQPSSEEILVDLIPSDAGNHNAGSIRFGIDGKLYIATGDGGQTPALSQNLNSLAGKILRINADGSIPSDNPFFGMANHRPEIWAYGFRNPFRFAFRPGTLVPYIGDVGGTRWEEVNVGLPGANFGWPTAEGESTNPSFVNPIHAYAHNGESKSITGGVFMRSPRFPAAWADRYVFADYVQDDFFYLDVNSTNQVVQQGNLGYINGPVDFLMGNDGSLYYSAIRVGQIRKITYEPRPTTVTLPAYLYGGEVGSGTVSLDVVAPTAGLSVSLVSSNPAVSVPSSVVVPSASFEANFALSTSNVASDTVVSVTATAFTKSAASSLTVRRNILKGVYAVPTISSGGRIRGYAAFFAPVTSGTQVSLSSNNAALTVPGAVLIPAATASSGFWIDAGVVSASTTVTVQASYEATVRTRVITVTP